jgi:hypothetical protein
MRPECLSEKLKRLGIAGHSPILATDFRQAFCFFAAGFANPAIPLIMAAVVS